MIQITLHTDDLFVSAVDNNQPGTPTVFPDQRVNPGMSSQRLNHGVSSLPFAVQEDGSGKFSITTVSTDANDPTRTKSQLQSGSAGDQVNVEAS